MGVRKLFSTVHMDFLVCFLVHSFPKSYLPLRLNETFCRAKTFAIFLQTCDAFVAFLCEIEALEGLRTFLAFNFVYCRLCVPVSHAFDRCVDSPSRPRRWSPRTSPPPRRPPRGGNTSGSPAAATPTGSLWWWRWPPPPPPEACGRTSETRKQVTSSLRPGAVSEKARFTVLLLPCFPFLALFAENSS